jgi:hypothetical protein
MTSGHDLPPEIITGGNGSRQYGTVVPSPPQDPLSPQRPLSALVSPCDPRRSALTQVSPLRLPPNGAPAPRVALRASISLNEMRGIRSQPIASLYVAPKLVPSTFRRFPCSRAINSRRIARNRDLFERVTSRIHARISSSSCLNSLSLFVSTAQRSLFTFDCLPPVWSSAPRSDS